MNSTGPSGSSSIGFSTGSVVVPAKSLTMLTSCRVMALSRLRLADVAAAEDADVQAHALGGRPVMPMRVTAISPPPGRPSCCGVPRRQTASAVSSSSYCSAREQAARRATTSRIGRARRLRPRARPRTPPRSRSRAPAPWRPRSRRARARRSAPRRPRCPRRSTGAGSRSCAPAARGSAAGSRR